ncbi:MAG: hypothetical protein ACK5MA_04395 [Parachlamydiaceae bacterium]
MGIAAMWRNKSRDLTSIDHFLESLEQFRRLKEERWEAIDEKVQMSIVPGTPSEDWIIPPDEDLTLKELKKDADYMHLRSSLTASPAHLKKIALFVRFNTHHDLDEVHFVSPLLGQDVIEDAQAMARELRCKCLSSPYILLNIKHLFRLSD